MSSLTAHCPCSLFNLAYAELRRLGFEPEAAWIIDAKKTLTAAQEAMDAIAAKGSVRAMGASAGSDAVH